MGNWEMLGVVRPYQPVPNDIVTPCYLLVFAQLNFSVMFFAVVKFVSHSLPYFFCLPCSLFAFLTDCLPPSWFVCLLY